MYDYVEFARYEARIERIAACIESGKTEDGAELTEELRQRYAAQVEYYQQDLKQRAVKFVDYKHQFDKYEKEVASGLTMLDGLLTPEGKSKLELR
jgi:predicted secreted acid phosphatase